MTTMSRHFRLCVRFLCGLALGQLPSAAPAQQPPIITLATANFMERSGLLGTLLPAFARDTGIEVFAVPIGSEQALKAGERGECDVILVYDGPDSVRFIRDGFGIEPHIVLYEEVVLVGPQRDPAGVGGGHDLVTAFRKIAQAKARFLSPGGNFSSAKKEARIWEEAGITPQPGRDIWYGRIYASTSETLATAVSQGEYILTDRLEWLQVRQRGDIKILVESDKDARVGFNIVLVNPARYPKVQRDAAMTFINWLTSPVGQEVIAGFKIDGEQAFIPASGAGSSDPNG